MLLSSKGLLAILVAVLAIIVSNVLNTLKPFKAKLATNDSKKCKVTDGPWGAEDLVMAKQNWILTSSADGGYFFERGVDACKERSGEKAGGIWAISATDSAPEPARLTMEGLSDNILKEPCFMTHGLYISNTTDRLYAVTHYGTHSSIEIYNVRYSDEQPPTLQWIRSVSSSAFPNVGINDVVEGRNANELYVTQWLPSFASFPTTGRRNPTTFAEKFHQAIMVPVFLLGLKLTKVYHCTFSDDTSIPAVCKEATSQRFRIANGITISQDRQTVFVNDVLSYTITVFRRQESGMLTKIGEIPLEYAVDNIEWYSSENQEELWMGTIPDLLTVATNEDLPYEERKIVSGGLAVVRKNDDGKWGEQQITYNHDGTLLSQISHGLTHGGKTYLGSSYAYGILVCEND